MLSNKKLNPIVAALFTRDREQNIYLVFSHSLTSLFQKILDYSCVNTILYNIQY